MHCFIFAPRHVGPPSGAPAGSPDAPRSPPGREKRQRDPKKAARRGVGARCHAKAPPKDRIFGCTRSIHREADALTCGFLESASGSIRPIDVNSILWRDFCSGVGRPRCPAAHPGRMAGQSFTTLTNARTNLSSVPNWRHSASLCAAFVKIMHPPVSTPAFFECLRATCTRDAPCTRLTRDAFLRYTPTRRAPQSAPGRNQKRAGSATHCRPAMVDDNPRPTTTPTYP